MSIRSSGLARRSFIIGSRLWPPAITRASGPRSASSAIALSTLVARAYSIGPGSARAALPRRLLVRRASAEPDVLDVRLVLDPAARLCLGGLVV